MPRKDPIARAAYNKEYNAKNAEARRIVEQVRYHEKGGKEQQQEYRKDRLPQYAGYQRKRRMTHPKETLVDQAKYRAKKKNLPFNVTVATIEWPTHCPVLGIELDYHCMHAGNRKIQPNSPTLDRRVNELGYVVGNVFVLSHRANRLKQDASPEELTAITKYANT